MDALIEISNPMLEDSAFDHAGGPVPPTGKAIAADYLYVMEFEGEKIRHLTKIWNDAQSLRAPGGALYRPCDVLTHPSCEICGCVVHRAAW
jgi:hypothetical protein